MVLYDYQSSRAGECAGRFLEGLTGLLHADGYEAYHCKLPPEITVAGCWAHMRRKFTDTLKSLPKELRDRSPAKIGLDYCDKLFHLESGYSDQKLSFQQRYQTRLEQSKPVAEKFFAWAKAEYEKNPVPKSMLGAALTYAVNQESWLMNVFGRLELSNNRAERAVRDGTEELAVLQHTKRCRCQRGHLLHCGDRQGQRPAAVPIPQIPSGTPALRLPCRSLSALGVRCPKPM